MPLESLHHKGRYKGRSLCTLHPRGSSVSGAGGSGSTGTAQREGRAGAVPTGDSTRYCLIWALAQSHRKPLKFLSVLLLPQMALSICINSLSLLCRSLLFVHGFSYLGRSRQGITANLGYLKPLLMRTDTSFWWCLAALGGPCNFVTSRCYRQGWACVIPRPSSISNPHYPLPPFPPNPPLILAFLYSRLGDIYFEFFLKITFKI